MASKLCPKIIPEGTRLTFKTEIAFLLNEHPQIVGPRKYRYHSPVISAEWCAFTNFPWGRGLINYKPEEEQTAMETYSTWCRLFELQKYYSWIIDRFHISTMAYPGRTYQNKPDFSWLEERLNVLGFHLVFCTRNEDSFIEARERRLKVSGNPKQYDDIGYFISEQEQMRNLINNSILPKKEIDVSDNNLNRTTDEIAAWLIETGGLYAKD